MYSNTKTDRFKDFKLFKAVDEKFLTSSFYKTMQANYFLHLKKRLKEEDSIFKFKMDLWNDIEERKKLYDEVNDLIHREYEVSIQKNQGAYFQQLFNKETPLPGKKVQSIQFVDDYFILQYSVDQSLQQQNSQQDFDKMIYKSNQSTFISQIDEEEGNVKIDYKVTNWIENYFQEGQPESVMPMVYKVMYFNLAISLAFFYKFVKNALY